MPPMPLLPPVLPRSSRYSRVRSCRALHRPLALSQGAQLGVQPPALGAAQVAVDVAQLGGVEDVVVVLPLAVAVLDVGPLGGAHRLVRRRVAGRVGLLV